MFFNFSFLSTLIFVFSILILPVCSYLVFYGFFRGRLFLKWGARGIFYLTFGYITMNPKLMPHFLSGVTFFILVVKFLLKLVLCFSFFIILLITVFDFFKDFRSSQFRSSNSVFSELLIVVFLSLLIILLVFASFNYLYCFNFIVDNSFDTSGVIFITGNQWYWDYDCLFFIDFFNSFS